MSVRGILYNVMTRNIKEVLVNLRLKTDVRDDFKIAAHLRGATMSGLLHQYIVKVIREEKLADAYAFNEPNRTATLDMLNGGDVERPLFKAAAGTPKPKKKR